MCQMSVYLEQDGQQEKVMENVNQLEVTPEGVIISTMFEEPKLLAGARVKKIDFLSGTMTISSSKQISREGGNND